MSVRRIDAEELPELLGLYAILHPEDPVCDPAGGAVLDRWRQILRDPKLRYYVASEDRRIVATCTLTVIPNLTRGLRPYGVIENVVTAPAYRRKGHATRVVRCALNEAWSEGCYKVMLATGSKDEATLRFYENVGFRRGVKIGFIAFPQETALPK